MRAILPTWTVAALVLLLGGPQSLHAAIGDPVTGDFQVNAYSSGAQGQPAIAPDSGGGFVVVWHSDGSPTDHDSFSVQARRFDPTGTPLADEFQVNTYTTSPQREPAIAPDGAGGFFVVWQSGGSTGTDDDFTSIQARRFDAAGAPLGGEFQVNTYTTASQVSPGVARDGAGGFVVVWSSNGGSGTDADEDSIQAQRFDGGGAPVGGEFQVNGYTTGSQYDVVVSPDGGGGYVVVWASDGGAGSDTNFASIQAQRFSGGGPVGGQFQVNSYTTGVQRYPAVTPLEGGGFVVAWQSDSSSGSDRSDLSVQAQRFNASGTPVGGQFQVNTFTTAAQAVPAVGRDGGGGFVVVWTSEGSPGTDQSTTSAHGRRFDASGTPDGGEFQVNAYTSSEQDAYAVAPDGSGGFVVAWDSLGSADTDNNARSVQARRFVGPNSPTTTLPPGVTTTTLPSGAEGLTGKRLKLSAEPTHAKRSKFALRSKDRRVTLGAGNQSADDPVLHGGQLTIASTAGGFSKTHVLVGGWKYVGKAGKNKGYKWKSKSSPIRKIVIKRRKAVKVSGRGDTLGFDLNDNPNPVRVTLGIGAHVYCLEFGGRQLKFKPDRRWAAKKAPAPTICP
jgi:hypothetical protein